MWKLYVDWFVGRRVLYYTTGLMHLEGKRWELEVTDRRRAKLRVESEDCEVPFEPYESEVPESKRVELDSYDWGEYK